MEDEYTSPLHSHVGTEVIFTGTLVAPPDIRQRTQHLLVSDGEDTILVFADRFESFVYGDQVTVTGTLTLPESFITDLGRTWTNKQCKECDRTESRYDTCSEWKE